jgi:hypothetical protein
MIISLTFRIKLVLKEISTRRLTSISKERLLRRVLLGDSYSKEDGMLLSPTIEKKRRRS